MGTTPAVRELGAIKPAFTGDCNNYCTVYLNNGSSKSDSAPVCGEAYEPASLWTQ
jgi:hypothetical protein